jgi:hypothetical protein
VAASRGIPRGVVGIATCGGGVLAIASLPPRCCILLLILWVIIRQCDKALGHWRWLALAHGPPCGLVDLNLLFWL